MDRPVLRQQETLEGLRSDEQVQGFPQAHRHPLPTYTEQTRTAPVASRRGSRPHRTGGRPVCSATPSARGVTLRGRPVFTALATRRVPRSDAFLVPAPTA